MLTLSTSLCNPGLTDLVSLEHRERVTMSRHHPEVFPDRSMMSMARVFPPHSWVLQAVSSCSHFQSLSPWFPAPEAELPSSSLGTHRAGVSWAVLGHAECPQR